MIRKLLFRTAARPSKPCVPDGTRVYAIGDVHGRADLLEDLLEQIALDNDQSAPSSQHLVFLGDLIDRGPSSREVVEIVMRLAASDPQVHVLKGNHEEVALQAISGDARAMRLFSRIGGRETLESYGVSRQEFESGSYQDLTELAANRVPEEHRRFLQCAKDSMVIGDYLFVHAGIRPSAPMAQQATSDLRWIRGEFLDFEGELEKVVVHGHSVAAEVEQKAHRIGIDTGAYRTGVLTALVLEGSERRFLQTGRQLAAC